VAANNNQKFREIDQNLQKTTPPPKLKAQRVYKLTEEDFAERSASDLAAELVLAADDAFHAGDSTIRISLSLSQTS
jgi:hypothetical protein